MTQFFDLGQFYLLQCDVGDTKQLFGSVISFLKNLEIRRFGLAKQYR